MDEVLLKQLTGGDQITARKLYQNSWSFWPTHKIGIVTNYPPEISSDHAVKRRIRVVPFVATIPDEERESDLAEKLCESEAPGILNWMIGGCREYLEGRLTQSEEVDQATRSYCEHQDVVLRFLRDVCTPGESVSTKELYCAYVAWCGDSGEKILPKQAFNRSMKDHRFDSYHSNGPRYRGLRLRDGSETAKWT